MFLLLITIPFQADRNGPEFKTQHNNTEQLIKVRNNWKTN